MKGGIMGQYRTSIMNADLMNSAMKNAVESKNI
jgi:hypothetical protein